MVDAFEVIWLPPSDAMRKLGLAEDQMERVEIEDVVYYNAPTLGLSFLTSDRRVFAIQLRAVPAGREGRRTPLPRALEFHMGRSQVVALLGEPHKRGSASEYTILGKMPAWDASISTETKFT